LLVSAATTTSLVVLFWQSKRLRKEASRSGDAGRLKTPAVLLFLELVVFQLDAVFINCVVVRLFGDLLVLMKSSNPL